MKKIFIVTGLAVIFAFFHTSKAEAAGTIHPIGKGIFAITTLKQFTTIPQPRDALLQNPDVDGIVLVALWNELELQDNAYVWADLDAALDKIAQAGKRVNLHFRPGMYSPEWIYGAGNDNGCGQGDTGIQNGAVKFTFRRIQDNVQIIDQDETAPLPWNAFYLNKWKGFITQAGKRYNNRPEISYIIAAGPSLTHATANDLKVENTIENSVTTVNCGNVTDLQRFIDAGYTEDKITNAWKTLIDHYAQSFPNHQITFAPSDNLPLQRSADQALEIIQYGLQKYGSRFNLAPQHLDGTWLPNLIDNCLDHNQCTQLALVDRAVRDASQTTSVGWQMIEILTGKTPEKQQSLESAINLAINQLGGSWLEIFSLDVRNPQYQAIIHSTHNLLNPSSNPGDLTDEGDTPGDEVNIYDYNILVSDFGKTGSPGWIKADINKDGKVDIFDYNALVENFGQ